jgi:uncharacterized protein (DUF2236 family)
MTSTPLFPTGPEVDQLLTGPESVSWRFGSDARLYLAMLYPLLLQVAHPTVGAGVRDYSNFESRPWDRLFRSLDWVTLLVYGGQEGAAAGQRLRALHKEFRGTREDGKRYYALEPEAYAWVHATLLESYVAGHERFGRPMSAEQRERFYTEYRGLGRLVGVRDGDLPEDWVGFRAYFDRMMREELVRTESVDRVLRAIRGGARPPIPLPDPVWRTVTFPAQRAMWLGGLGLMPPYLRERLGVRWTRTDDTAFRSLGRISRSLTPVLPRRLQVMGPDQLRLRRRAIARGPLGAAAGAGTTGRTTEPDARSGTRAAA